MVSTIELYAKIANENGTKEVRNATTTSTPTTDIVRLATDMLATLLDKTVVITVSDEPPATAEPPKAKRKSGRPMDYSKESKTLS